MGWEQIEKSCNIFWVYAYVHFSEKGLIAFMNFQRPCDQNSLSITAKGTGEHICIQF